MIPVAHTLRADGFDASEDGTGRGTPRAPVAVDTYNQTVTGDVTQTLCSRGDTPGGTSHVVPAIVFDTTQITSAANYSRPKPGDPCHPLAAGAHAPAVAFNWQGVGTQTSLGYDPEAGIAGALHVGQTPAVAIQAGALRQNPNSGPDGVGVQSEVAYTLEARAEVQCAQSGMAVRRLTPRECERLQGFPEIEKHYRIRVCRDFSDQQKQNARAALKCPKWPSNVWRADASGWTLSASAAADHSSTSHPDHEPPVAVDVLIDLERQVVRLHSQGRSFSPASSVGDRSEFPLPTGVESFARLAVLLTHAWDLATPDGKAASPASTTHSIPHWSGSSIALLSGREIGGHADDAANAIATATRLSTSTTLPSGLDTQTYDSMLETLCCCVVHAIGSYIPGTTSAASSFDVRLTTTRGYTAIPWRGKPASECPDGPRYKALGNSFAVPVVRWLGERIIEVEAACSSAKSAA